MRGLTIATRGSKLALWQAEHIRALLMEEHRLDVSLLVLKTRGDVIKDAPISGMDGKGFFVREIEDALLDGRADLAVHSIKDLPMKLPAGLKLGAVPARASAHDLLLSFRYSDLSALPEGAKVGTGSPRRRAQLLAERPDLDVSPLRGNVDTRIKKLERGDFAAVVMAAAGLERLGLCVTHMHELAPPRFLPAPGQGALGLEFRADRVDVESMLAFLDDPQTRACVEAERAFLDGLGGGCLAPVAAFASFEGFPNSPLALCGLLADLDGTRIIRQRQKGQAGEARGLGLALAESVLAAGGDEIINDIAHKPGKEPER
ncbi:MAG: hydroxymethylbilane synthase [Desulfovibrio sp.]|jgi:hydroxymethylbilane synthase|nr:hydroxymethylbilane synthase [Desulfovibrio sp.]